MKKLTSVLVLICALAVLGAVPSVASAAIRYQVCRGTPAPIRTAPEASAPIIGYLTVEEIFEAKQNSANGFDHGWAYGSVHAEGYMNRMYECPA